jgi:hypothetical protein
LKSLNTQSMIGLTPKRSKPLLTRCGIAAPAPPLIDQSTTPRGPAVDCCFRGKRRGRRQFHRTGGPRLHDLRLAGDTWVAGSSPQGLIDANSESSCLDDLALPISMALEIIKVENYNGGGLRGSTTPNYAV